MTSMLTCFDRHNHLYFGVQHHRITQSHSDIWAQCLQMVSMRHNREKPNLGCSPVCFLAVLEPWAVSGTGGMSQDTYFSHVCQILAAFVEWKYLKAIFISMFLKTFSGSCVSVSLWQLQIYTMGHIGWLGRQIRTRDTNMVFLYL